jgi:hypothetical protein
VTEAPSRGNSSPSYGGGILQLPNRRHHRLQHHQRQFRQDLGGGILLVGTGTATITNSTIAGNAR